MSIWHWSPWSPDNVNFIPLPCTMMWNVFGMLVKVPFSCIIIGTNCLISIDCTIRIDSVCRSVVPLMSNIGKVRKWKILYLGVTPHGTVSHVMDFFLHCTFPSSSSPDPLFTQSGLFFIQAGPFYAEWGSFSNRKAPFPQCLARLQWVWIINSLASPGLPFKIRGPLEIQWIFVL